MGRREHYITILINKDNLEPIVEGIPIETCYNLEITMDIVDHNKKKIMAQDLKIYLRLLVARVFLVPMSTIILLPSLPFGRLLLTKVKRGISLSTILLYI